MNVGMFGQFLKVLSSRLVVVHHKCRYLYVEDLYRVFEMGAEKAA